MPKRPIVPDEQLTDDDVLHIDPVHEFERRQQLRKLADRRLKKTGDESDAVVQLGRPTGP